MSSQYCRTIDELEQLYYTNKGVSLLMGEDMNSPFVNKSDAPVVSTTTGVYNAVYGAQAWVQLNQEANSLGATPKSVHRRSGWRVITARASASTAGGVTEGGALPDTIKPTFAEVSTKPKTIAHTFDNSEIQEFLAQSEGDDAYAAMHQLRMYMAVEHREHMNKMLNTQGGTLASTNLESMDRVVGSYAELSYKENDESTSFSTNDLDIYGLDRDAGASWADAYVGGAAAVRSLTDSLMQGIVQNTLSNGANKNGQFIQTGYDTWSVLNQLYDAQVRYNIIGETKVKPGVNGIEGIEGTGVGISVAKYLHAPVIQSKDTVVDTGGISRLYLFDTSNPEGFDLPRLSLRIAKPTQYFEAGMNQGNPFVVNRFGTEGMYRTMGELVCTFFKAQGKLRDLKA